MSERPIEEIIGWTRNPWYSLTEQPPPNWWRDQNDELRTGYTVDDLAAWLDDRQDWDFQRWTSSGRSKFHCYGFGPGPEWITEDCPTILAALEAAVRKVAA